jgi:putative transposase
VGLAGGRWRDDQGAVGRPQDRPESHRQSEKRAKRSVLTDAAGVPIGLAHEGAHRHDQKLLAQTIESIPIERPEPTARAPQGLCLDRAYDAPPMHALATEHGLTAHIRTRGDEIADKLRTPGWRARRWVVEACHSWLNRNRALLIRWSKKPENHLALLQLACGLIAFKKAHAARLAHALPG